MRLAGRWILAVAVLATLLLAVASAWFTRHWMNPDGISYIEISDAVLRGDVSGVVNGYWSPLYPVVLAATRAVLRPSKHAEFAAVHVANFLVWLFSLATFTWLIREVVRRYAAEPRTRFWLFVTGYALFVWATVEEVRIAIVTPDLMVTAFVWLLAALSLKSSDGKLMWSALLGAACGLAYLTKSVMFLGSAGFLLAGLPSLRRRSWPVLLVSFAAFAAVAAPWIGAVSARKGRLTFGDTGKMAYAMFIDNVPYASSHWYGQPPENGTPAHAVRIIFDHPLAFEFAEPFHVTYPPWFEPSYWNEGLRAHFRLRGQVHAVVNTAKMYYLIFARRQWAFGIFLLLLFVSAPAVGWLTFVRRAWRLALPPLLVIALYGIVWVDIRYVGGFVALLFLAMFVAVADAAAPSLLRVAAAVVSVSILATTVAAVAAESAERLSEPHDWGTAMALTRAGLRPGDGVASVEMMIDRYWARHAGARVVAETPDGSAREFWSIDPPRRAALLDAFRRAGATIVVAPAPGCSLHEGWVPLPGNELWYRRIASR